MFNRDMNTNQNPSEEASCAYCGTVGEVDDNNLCDDCAEEKALSDSDHAEYVASISDEERDYQWFLDQGHDV